MTSKEGLRAGTERGPCPCPQGLALRDRYAPCGNARAEPTAPHINAEGLAKALVAQAVGAGDGLASERTYTLRTLPRAVVRGFADSFRGDPSALTRAGAITAGLALTTAGYLEGGLPHRQNPTGEMGQ